MMPSVVVNSTYSRDTHCTDTGARASDEHGLSDEARGVEDRHCAVLGEGGRACKSKTCASTVYRSERRNLALRNRAGSQ